MIDPMTTIRLSRRDRESLIRTAKACGHVRALQWLESLSRSEGDGGDYELLFGDMKVYLTEIALDPDIVRCARTATLCQFDIDVFCGMLSHCLQTHVDAEDVVSGDMPEIIRIAEGLEANGGRTRP
jgi:hypothetical protein